jgi:predicted acyltransferase
VVFTTNATGNRMQSANPKQGVSQTLSSRFVSVDVMRGLTVAFMILVNNNGQNDQAYVAMNHSPWNGFTPTDLVFPTFLFIMGVSMVLSFEARLRKGFSTTEYLLHTFRRFVILVFFGLIVNGFPFFHLDTLRIYGVLQRIALCYLLGSLLQLVDRGVWTKVAVLVISLVGYWVLMRWIPVPHHGIPGGDFPLLDPDINLTAYLDRHMFPGRLFEGRRDPEGFLSTLPALGTTLLGMITGLWLRSSRSLNNKLNGILMAGIVAVTAGQLWSYWFPLNKKLWTSSYVLYAGGWTLLILALCYFVVEIKNLRGRWTYPWLVFGTNAITAYVFSELLSSTVAVVKGDAGQSLQHYLYWTYFVHVLNPAFGSLVYSVCFAAICWIPVALLYRKKIFLKI